MMNIYKTCGILLVGVIALGVAEVAQGYTSYEAKLYDWIEGLEYEESRGNTRAKVFDSNAKYSYGCLQFQLATWKNQGDKYGMDTTKENIYNCSMQKELAKRMIRDDRSNWEHWYNSVTEKGLGKPPKKFITNSVCYAIKS